eukprot:maker-scaffold339_size202159-snap-gene-1.24 protein:Tk01779 transcript:maker-scaffold339_size202159-snap-gene-1.24-mRNA-1 annotation:"hypothetical protein TRIADDRAFT_26073"
MSIWCFLCVLAFLLPTGCYSLGETCSSSETAFVEGAEEALAGKETREPGTCAPPSNWKLTGIPEELRNWIDEMESSAIEPIAPPTDVWTAEDADSCYSSDDIEAIFAKNGDNLTSKVDMRPLVHLAELNGSGRIIFLNGTRLESSYFHAGFVKPGFPAMMFTADKGTFFLGNTVRGGCFHGRVRGFKVSTGRVSQVMAFDQGTPVGSMWHIQRSNIENRLVGLLHVATAGRFEVQNPPQDFTGKRISFIYPDFNTTIQGSFRRGVMLLCREVLLRGIRFNEFGVMEMQTSEPFGPDFRRDVSTYDTMSMDPMLRDPYEAKMVTVQQSLIPKAGDGVFTSQNVPADTIIAYFNGIRLKEKHIFNPVKMFKKKSIYLVEIGEVDDFLDVLPEFASWESYQASAGHKVNHGKNHNCGYTECEHPRFGNILCLATNQEMKAGTELLTLYNVAFDKQGMKNLLKTALSLGHMVSGKDKKAFVKDVKPYLQMASKWAEIIKIDELVQFDI